MKALLIYVLLLISTSLFSQVLPQKIYEDNQIIINNGYIVSYNETCEQANWVYYTIKPSDLIGNEITRRNDFREDYSVKTGSAKLSDYKNSGYDRGHLKASGDEPCDSIQMSETFLLSNIAPMDASFNRGIWLKLENEVRKIAIESDSVIVITGGVLKEGLKTIGSNNVCVPTHFFKVLYIYKKKELEVLCFVIPNKKSDEPLYTYLVKVIVLEDFVGIDF